MFDYLLNAIVNLHYLMRDERYNVALLSPHSHAMWKERIAPVIFDRLGGLV